MDRPIPAMCLQICIPTGIIQESTISAEQILTHLSVWTSMGDGLADMIKQSYTNTPNGQDYEYESYVLLNTGNGYERIFTEEDWDTIETIGRRLIVHNPDNNDIYSLVYSSNLQQVEDVGFNAQTLLDLGRGYFQSALLDFDGDGLLDKIYVNYDERWFKFGTNRNEHGSYVYPENSYELLRGAPNVDPDEFSVALNYMGIGFLPAKSVSGKEMAAAIARVRDVRRHDTLFYATNNEFLALFDDEDFYYRYGNVGVVEDIDGDGFNDYLTVSYDAPQTYKVQKRVYDTPPGLLKRVIHSGGLYHPYDPSRRGGFTNIRYARIHDETVVQSDIEIGKSPKSGRFVVKSIAHIPGIYPGHAQPKMEQSFRYVNPVWNRDEMGRTGFRGFEKVQKIKIVYAGLEGWTHIQETTRDFFFRILRGTGGQNDR